MSNNLLSNIVIFAVGAAIGSVITWKYVETKYKRIADEEIESVKETYSRRYSGEVDRENDVMVSSRFDNKPDIQEYASLVGMYDRVREDDEEYDEDDEEEEYDDDYPYEDDKNMIVKTAPDEGDIRIISPEEYDEHDYNLESLTYYADGVLTDGFGDVMDDQDIENTVGADFYKHFGEYEDDSVFVRNDWLEIDYEILKDYRNYADVFSEED